MKSDMAFINLLRECLDLDPIPGTSDASEKRESNPYTWADRA